MRTELNLKKYLWRTAMGILIFTLIPYVYNFSGLGLYGYGYNVGGTVLWTASAFLIALLYWSTVKKRDIQALVFIPSPLRLDGTVYAASIVFVVLYVVFVFLSRLPSISMSTILDTSSNYSELTRGGGNVSLNVLGQLGAVLAPLSMLFIPRAILETRIRYYLIVPALIFVICNLLMGKRQIFLFFCMMCFFSLIIARPKLNIRKFLGYMTIGVFVLSAMLYFGYSRGGWSSLDEQLAHNSRVLNLKKHQNLAFLGLPFLYTGGGAEVLSVAVDHFEPTYKPFSVTNSFLLRRINSVVNYVDYEKDIVPHTSGQLALYLGSFGRIWAGGNLQLYAEGGWWLTAAWYASLLFWWRYIIWRVRRGRAESVDFVVFSSVVTLHMLVFPLRDQFIFFTFLWYVLFVLLRHLRWDLKVSR